MVDKGDLECEGHSGVSLKVQTRVYESDSWSGLLVSEILSGRITDKFMNYPEYQMPYVILLIILYSLDH